jgi:hypothetical protein
MSDVEGRKKMKGIWEQLVKMNKEQWDRVRATDD